MIRRAAVVAMLAALVLAGLTLFEPRRIEPPAPVTTPEGSDHYLLDAVVEQYNPDGRLHYRVTAAESLHFPNDSMRLNGIRVHYPGDAGGQWHLTAARGRIPPESRNLLLTGDVTLTHAPAAAGPVTVATPHVWLRPQENRADTEAPVTVHGPGQRVLAQGMTAYFERGVLDLHRDVRVIYNP